MNTKSKSSLLTSNRQKGSKSGFLLPSALPSGLSLTEGIQQLVQTVNTHYAFHVELVHSGLEQALIKEPIGGVVYQIVKTQIKNIIRQTQATAATVHLAKNHGQVAIVVEDNDAAADLSKMKNSRGFKTIQSLWSSIRASSIFLQRRREPCCRFC